uniref:Uncharacterized protein n=1 Tax=Oryza glumipatula TaxID=40148 RepID=A0A0E0B8T6_9ORYZ
MQGAEMSATGLFFLSRVIPRCVVAVINKATTLKDVVGGVAEVLLVNKLATREDANKVAVAAAQNDRRHASGGRELTRSIQSRSESIRNPIPHRADVFFFSAGKRSPMVGTKCVRERILQSPGQSGAGQESSRDDGAHTRLNSTPRPYPFPLSSRFLSSPRSPSRFPSILLLVLLSTNDALPLRHSTSLSPITSLLNNESERRPSHFFSHPPRISREKAPRVDKRILIHSPPPLTHPSLSLSITPSHPRPHPSRLSPVGSRGGGSDGVNCSRGLDPTVAVASAAPAGESGGGGGGVVSGRRIRWRLFRRVDPAVLYPLVLTLHAQACPAAVASALPRADLAEVVAAAFLMGRSSGPPHTPPPPQASLADPPAPAAASPLDPVAAAAAAATTLVAPTGDPAKGICLTPPTSPRPDPPLLLVVYLLFVYVMMMSLLRLILGFLCDVLLLPLAPPFPLIISLMIL